jgi:hypothetical protein
MEEIIMAYRAEDVAKLFALDGEPMIAVPFGCGHINDTYFVETSRARKYILQKVMFIKTEKEL